MPWEINIVRYLDEVRCDLGDRQMVIDHVARIAPGKGLAPPPLPPQADLDRMSAETRAAFLRPILSTIYQEGDLSIEFWCPDSATISCLHADVRGEGDPLPVLRSLCLPCGWTVLDLAEYQRCVHTCSALELKQRASVDLDAPTIPQWDSFTRALRELIDEIEPANETSDPGASLDG